MRGVSKSFPGVLALDSVDFELRAGEVHALFGENGAGKSTLINIIAGTFPPDRGTFVYRGQRVAHLTPHQARLMGISPVFQEFSLVPGLTVEQNLFLGRETSIGPFLSRKAMRAKARGVIDELGFELDPDRKVEELSRARQQMVEIAKAFLTNVRLLILDEPTASLTDLEVARLFELVMRLRASGVGIIYVSHRMRDIRKIGDRITVLRDGRNIETVAADTVTDRQLVELMTGRKIELLFPHVHHEPRRKLLEIENLSLATKAVSNVSMHVRAGEIAGIAGLVGCGKSEMLRAVYGLEPISAGIFRVDGTPFVQPSPKRALKAGLCYFPSDRVAEGLALTRPVRENASMAGLDLPNFARWGILRRAAERKAIQAIAARLKLHPPRIERLVGNLSGGNRQKVLLARGLTRDTRIFLFDEPTVGIDVGAKIEVYELMKALAEGGAAILLASSELPEVLNLSNRLYVMHRGSLVAELTGADINETAVLSYFFNEESATATPEAARFQSR